jgi:hypothetical protein
MHLSEKGVMKCDPNAHSLKAVNADLEFVEGHGNTRHRATIAKHPFMSLLCTCTKFNVQKLNDCKATKGATGLTQSHLRALDSFIGPRIFYPLLADELVPFGTQVVDGGLHACQQSFRSQCVNAGLLER